MTKASNVLQLGSGDWPPYTQNVPGNYGLVTELVEATVTQMRLLPRIQWLPWKRNESFLSHGKIYANFPYRKTAERSLKYDFSEPLMYTTTQLYYNKKSVTPVSFEKFSDLKGVRIGGVRGYSYIGDFQAGGAQLTMVNSDLQLVKLLISNRVNFAALDSFGGFSLLNDLTQLKSFEIGMIAKPLYQKSPSRLMVSRHYPNYKQLLRHFNRALLCIKENGIYQKIVLKHAPNPQLYRQLTGLEVKKSMNNPSSISCH